ncbi:hypothetical protein CF326_g6125 [Tilletia indica]|nr:hypothetical protein CF326_g6125 [Tilletia indica]
MTDRQKRRLEHPVVPYTGVKVKLNLTCQSLYIALHAKKWPSTEVDDRTTLKGDNTKMLLQYNHKFRDGTAFPTSLTLPEDFQDPAAVDNENSSRLVCDGCSQFKTKCDKTGNCASCQKRGQSCQTSRQPSRRKGLVILPPVVGNPSAGGSSSSNVVDGNQGGQRCIAYESEEAEGIRSALEERASLRIQLDLLATEVAKEIEGTDSPLNLSQFIGHVKDGIKQRIGIRMHLNDPYVFPIDIRGCLTNGKVDRITFWLMPKPSNSFVKLFARLPSIHIDMDTPFLGKPSPKYFPRSWQSESVGLHKTSGALVLAAIAEWAAEHPEATIKDVWKYAREIIDDAYIREWELPSWFVYTDTTKGIVEGRGKVMVKVDYQRTRAMHFQEHLLHEATETVSQVIADFPFVRSDWSTRENQIEACAHRIREALDDIPGMRDNIRGTDSQKARFDPHAECGSDCKGHHCIQCGLNSDIHRCSEWRNGLCLRHTILQYDSVRKRKWDSMAKEVARADSLRLFTDVQPMKEPSSAPIRSGYGEAAVDLPSVSALVKFCLAPTAPNDEIDKVFRHMPEGRKLVQIGTPMTTWDNVQEVLIFFQASCDLMLKYSPDSKDPLAHEPETVEMLFWGYNGGKYGKSLLRIELINVAALITRSPLPAVDKGNALKHIEALLHLTHQADAFFDTGCKTSEPTLQIARAMRDLSYGSEVEKETAATQLARQIDLDGGSYETRSAMRFWSEKGGESVLRENIETFMKCATGEDAFIRMSLSGDEKDGRISLNPNDSHEHLLQRLLEAFPDARDLFPEGTTVELATLLWRLILIIIFICDWVILICIKEICIKCKGACLLLVMVCVFIRYNNVDRYTGLPVNWYGRHHALRISVAHRQHNHSARLLDQQYHVRHNKLMERLLDESQCEEEIARLLQTADDTNVAIEALATNFYRRSWSDNVLMMALNHRIIRKHLIAKAVLLGVLNEQSAEVVRGTTITSLDL